MLFIILSAIIIICYIIKAISNRNITVENSIPEKTIERKPIIYSATVTETHAPLIEELLRNRSLLISKPANSKILHSITKFEKDVKSGKIDFTSMNEASPLACYGYKVGKTSDLSPSQRKDVLIHTWHASLPSFLPYSYARSWGEPGTYDRFIKIVNHLDMLVSTRSRKPNMEYAIKDWENDRDWLNREHLNTAQIYRDNI